MKKIQQCPQIHFLLVYRTALCALLGAAVWLSGLSATAGESVPAPTAVMDLTVELEKSPIGLDTPRPRFSWKLKPQEGRRGQMQQAYQLIIGTDYEGEALAKPLRSTRRSTLR